MAPQLARIAREIVEAQRPSSDRAYDRLLAAVRDGTAIDLSDHDLVLAVSRALWNRELATAQLGLTELEIRTAVGTVHEYDERHAA